jgi:hypothetical protein
LSKTLPFIKTLRRDVEEKEKQSPVFKKMK